MRFPCTMVVKNAERYAMESGSLKFGMDRILSEEISPNGNRSEEAWSSSPPCVGCISSVYRCCRYFTLSEATPFLGSGVRAPRPLGLCAPESDAPAEAPPASSSGAASKRKRSWSRAVFSNLQRKGLEKRFQLQKYITKPDRRQLAATLGLTDAQVKVWFQNRRMKWRHTKESFRPNPGAAATVAEAPENILASADSTRGHDSDSECGSDVDVQTVDT